MTTLSAPLAVNAQLPALALTTPSGDRTSWAHVRPSSTAIAYFMRTSSCPMCHQHLRQLETLTVNGSPAAARTVVIVPGGAAEAASVEKRHPKLSGRVFASENAHERVGLFVKMGMQQSGTFVVGTDDRIAYTKTATVPMGTFNEKETVSALG